MTKKSIQKITAILTLFSATVLVLCGIVSGSTPSHLIINTHNNQILNSTTALSIQCDANSLPAVNSGTQNAKGTLMLFGTVPVKEVNVDFSDRQYVTLGGMPFGIRIYTEGLMVSDTADISTDNGSQSPSAKADIEKGDVILSVNHESLKTNEQLQQAVQNSNGESIALEVKRNGIPFSTRITPVKDSQTQQYRVGLGVRDSCAGIGTMTFIDTDNGYFAGLGHGICDAQSGQLMPLDKGDIVPATISSVRKSACGNPGSLTGYFSSSKPVGKLYANNHFGVYGSIEHLNTDLSSVPKMPIAYRQEIRTGKAQIYTTIDNGNPQYYDIEIEEISYSSADTCKNMIIKITDPQLLAKTGGIVQGMSGSPIIQNHRIVGAVTHVFINDPTHGYAIFGETMMSNVDSITQNTPNKTA